MTNKCGNWQEEFVDIKFVDQRLKTRFFKIMDAFAASPENLHGQQPDQEAQQKQHTVSLVIQIFPGRNCSRAYPKQL